MAKQTLRLLPQEFTVHSLDATATVPQKVFEADIYFIGKTPDELSIACPSDIDIDSLEKEDHWVTYEVVGPLGFSLTGILSNISGVLADADISIFAVSTFDTDYIMVKKDKQQLASDVLVKDGYKVI